MSRVRDGLAIRNLQTILGEGSVGALADVVLLERFATHIGHEADFAFSVLVERHGPAVLRVCRSILLETHDAEDAFQATFLVLVRKAGKVQVRDSLGPWLVGVAYRIAWSVRSASALRIVIERDGASPGSQTAGDLEREELGQVVRDEIDRLPELYRRPILLCYLGGLTHESAARQLGCTVGTVRSRLAGGRQRLRDRLIRRGLAPATALAAIGSVGSARGGLAVRLVTSTTRAAVGKGSRIRAATAESFSAAAATHAGTTARAMIMKMFKWIVTPALAGAILATGGIGHGQQKGTPSPRADDAAPPVASGPGPALAARRAGGLEMLLHAARKQEELGNHERALELTGQMEEAARGWGAELRRKANVRRAVREGSADIRGADGERKEPRQPNDGQIFIALLDGERKEPLMAASQWQALTERRRGRLLVGEKKLLDRDEKTRVIQVQLEKRLSIALPESTTLEGIVQLIRKSSQDEKIDPPKGILIYIDPVALDKEGLTLESKVTIDVENAPLKDSLRLALDQLGLSYFVKDGLLVITSGTP